MNSTEVEERGQYAETAGRGTALQETRSQDVQRAKCDLALKAAGEKEKNFGNS